MASRNLNAPSGTIRRIMHYHRMEKEVGDLINKGDVLCEVETDKAAFEVESTTKGILLAILHEADADVEVLKPIAVIEKDEDISACR